MRIDRGWKRLARKPLRVEAEEYTRAFSDTIVELLHSYYSIVPYSLLALLYYKRRRRCDDRVSVIIRLSVGAGRIYTL